MTAHRRKINLGSLLIGVAATLGVVGAHLAGRLQWLELRTLDWRFRYANSITAHPDIVGIDIDDRSLELAGRWPWARNRQAALISLAADSGARAILVDLTWSEAEPVGTAAPANADMLLDPLSLSSDQAELIFPDYELRTAIASARNVYLAYHYPHQDLERSGEFNLAVDALRSGDEALAKRSIEQLDQRRAARPDRSDPQEERAWDRARLVAKLQDNPDGALDTFRAALPDVSTAFIERVFERARQAAVRRRLQRWLDENAGQLARPPWDVAQKFHATLTDRPFENETALRATALMALRELLGYRATLSNPLFDRERVGPIAARVEGITPVYYLHALAAKRCGFVVFEPDEDGVMRWMQLMGEQDGNILTQLAFSLGCDLLGARTREAKVEAGSLVIPTDLGGGQALRLQLDSQGRTLVPWVPPPRPLGEGDSAEHLPFRHIPAGKLIEIYDRRQQVAENERVIRDTLERVLASDIFEDADAYAAMLQRLKALRAEAAAARKRGDTERSEALAPALEEAEAKVAEQEKRSLEKLHGEFEQLGARDYKQLGPDGRRRFDTLELLVAELKRNEPYEQANAALRADMKQTESWLREQLDGKICLIGYTATSLADMTPTPTDKRAPGVMAHANLLNGMLTGQLVSWAPTWLNALIITVLGMWIAVVTLSRPPREAVFLLCVTILLYLALAGWAAFYFSRFWIAVAAPVVGAVLTFGAITVYTYIFVDRERRHLATALGQYTSREIARQVAENADLCKRAEMREVTAMFTDLKGFTSISERIGAERTQKVLNVCLGRFTDVMLRHEGMVNKFIGDGIFAFWNPVIYPQADHARRACETAIDLQVALGELKNEQKRGGGDDVFGELMMRVGVATGNAIVGPCGSEQKYDYTCIGDSVNVAARLESANKFYGTGVLVSGSAREQTGDAFVFRALGAVQVKGKQHAVLIHELLGRAGSLSDEDLEAAAAFEHAVERFRARDWLGARTAFERYAAKRPTDLAAAQYLAEIELFLRQPPADDWLGALELKEK